jgi:hypothetical protein
LFGLSSAAYEDLRKCRADLEKSIFVNMLSRNTGLDEDPGVSSSDSLLLPQPAAVSATDSCPAEGGGGASPTWFAGRRPCYVPSDFWPLAQALE